MNSDKKGRGVSGFQILFLQVRAGEVGQFLILADKGGGGVCKPPFLNDIICEQSLFTPILKFLGQKDQLKNIP